MAVSRMCFFARIFNNLKIVILMLTAEVKSDLSQPIDYLQTTKF